MHYILSLMDVATLAARLIRSFEGLRLAAYQDSGLVWTIGYGHTSGVTEGMSCAPEQAAEWLSADASNLFALVADKPMIAAAAYVSFGFNCGRHALELVLAGQATLTNFVHDRHGQTRAGLVARRELEAALIEASTAS